MSTAEIPEKDGWDVGFTQPQKATQPERDDWRAARDRLIDTARRYGWTKTDVSKRSGIPQATLWQWFDGTYAGAIGNQTVRVVKWLDSVSEMSSAAARIPVTPGYVPTPTSKKAEEALLFAQMMPEIVVITLGAGMGKTLTARTYCEARPHAYQVTMRPTTRTVHGMLGELALALDVTEKNPARLDRALGNKLKRNGRHTLLIVDEAQNLGDEAVNQLRYFLDEYGCGIALMGNEELYGRFGGNDAKPAYAQLHSRFGLRIRQLQPSSGDVEAILDAWGVTDTDIRKLMHAVARKPGALRQVSKVLQLAGMYAAGDQRDLTPADIKSAIANRGLEG